MNFGLKNRVLLALFFIFLPEFCFGYVKHCANTISETLPTKALKFEFFSSNNETWKKEIMSNHDHDHDHDHNHLTPSDEVAWSNLIPRKLLLSQENEFSWNLLYKKIKYSKNDFKGNFLNEISLQNVRLDPQSHHGMAQQTNLEYLLLLDVDNLLWSFRKTAGLPTPGSPYGGWEKPDSELRGHFVGHYMSATAIMWASTHNETLRAKMKAVVSGLKECQDAMKSGYLSAFPTEQFDRYEALQPVWAPYYTIHKIMAGLLDQYNFANDTQALQMVTSMADYFYTRVQNVVKKYTIERHYAAQNEETGGMNDVLYRLYTVTGDQKHLLLAHLFDKPCFLGILAMKADDISGFHTNTHVPIVIGAQQRYEITGDELYKEMGAYFLDVVNSTHSYATGGTSDNEAWGDPMRLGDALTNSENEESCTTYNMLKVARHLFKWTKQMMYADYYERAFINGVLSIQKRPEPGVMIYMLPLGHGVSKGKSYHGWGDQFNTFWCCYGTGIESFSKLGDSIYFEETGNVPELYVIQYIPSTLDWTSAQISLTQSVENVNAFNQSLKVKITVSAKQASKTATLKLRIPSWTSSSGSKASLNGNNLPLPSPGSFLNISKSWGDGDEITLEFPLTLRTEFLKDDRPDYALQAILYGPYLLAGLSRGDYDIQTGSVKTVSDWITPIPADYNSQLVSFTKENGNSTFFVSMQDQALTMLTHNQAMNDSFVRSTFRIIVTDPSPSPIKSSKLASLIGKVVKFEPIGLPGLVVAHRGVDKVLSVTGENDNKQPTEFFIVKGLNNKEGMVSLKTKEGCLLHADTSTQILKINCESGKSDPSFKEAVSFVWNEGLKKYSPISFLAKGLKKSYVLEPLLEMKNEFYNVYFNITT